MAQRSAVVGPPRRWVISGDYPDAELDAVAPNAAYWAAEVARRLRDAVADQSITEIAERAELARSTVYDIIAGRTWPDLVSIVKLQTTLHVMLWPDWAPTWVPSPASNRRQRK